ncbi:MAG: fenitrothion hydrolase [Solirubrobacteraceae bacterium]|nr:fenitrothion hydrolase [Solirubrobacteraceae bacterium]
MPVRSRIVALTGAMSLTGLILAPQASAHGIVGVQDLPIPRWLFGWAATIVLVLSFVALAVLWPKPKLQETRERRLLGIPRLLDPLCGALGVFAFGAVVYAGLAGSEVASANLAPTAIYVTAWVGLVFAALLFGDVWAALSPWRALGRLGGWVAQRLAGDGLPEPMPYPERLGRWPAAVGLIAFAWVELVWTRGDEPVVLAVLAIAYAVVMLVGMSLYGVEAWTRNADAFGVYFALFAKIAPLRWERGAVYGRPPLAGLPRMDAGPGTLAVLLAAIGITTFDGFSEGPVWTDVAPELTDAISSLGFAQATALQFAFTIGLLLIIGLVSGLFWLGIKGMQTVSKAYDAPRLAREFAHTLVPIAAAYIVAHYFSLLAYQGQAMGYLISNPLGDALAPGDGGLLGTAQWTIDYGWVGANAIWYVQVGALVVGHVAGLILAHDRAIALYGNAREATRSQYWMLAVMVAFTSLGLWLLSAANA